MEVTGVSEFAKKQISNLSGGQRQRVWIAMALAQNTKILLLDEPTTYLDVRYQIEILRLVKKLNTEYGITIIMVLHDINQSIAYSDCIIAMKDGKILAEGNPNDVINEELIKNVYGIELSVKEIEENKIVLTV
jgi:iron complex transport system ATP-binding protein